MSKICFEMQPLQNPPLCSITTETLPTRYPSPSFHLLIHTHSQNMICNLEFVPANGLLRGLYLLFYHSLYFRRIGMIIFPPVLTNRTMTGEKFLWLVAIVL
jgi:hypothetical protein